MTQARVDDVAILLVSRNTNCPRDHDKLSHQGLRFIVARRRPCSISSIPNFELVVALSILRRRKKPIPVAMVLIWKPRTMIV